MRNKNLKALNLFFQLITCIIPIRNQMPVEWKSLYYAKSNVWKFRTFDVFTVELITVMQTITQLI